MVACAASDNPFGPLRGIEAGDLVYGAANLEGEDWLAILSLEEYVMTQQRRQIGGEGQRRLYGHVVHI
eukprot:scaffold6519_cov156-Ochromonas_danica.AAC.1